MIWRSGLVVLLITAAAAAGLWAAGVPLGWAWLLAANLTAFLTYGYDKWVAGARPHSLRIPEAVLLGLALGGGTPAAYAAMRLFHHKTLKTSFLTRFVWIVAAQGLILLAYFIWGR